MAEEVKPLGPMLPIVAASPCRRCGCGSLCHWDDLAMPPEDDPVAWAKLADGIDCQRCPLCKGGYQKADR